MRWTDEEHAAYLKRSNRVAPAGRRTFAGWSLLTVVAPSFPDESDRFKTWVV